MVDVFEQASGVPVALVGRGIEIAIEPLPAGDYRIGGDILVERKSVPDLHGSLGRNRLWAQLGRLRDAAPYPYLLVEGSDIDAGNTCHHPPRAVAGRMPAYGRAVAAATTMSA